MQASGRACAAVAALLMVANVAWGARKNRGGTNHGPGPQIPTPRPQCAGILVGEKGEVLADALLAYLLSNTNAVKVFSDEDRKAKLVGKVGDVNVLHQGHQLKLVRGDSLDLDKSQVRSLEGDSLVEGWKLGDYYFVRTRIAAPAAEDREYSDRFYVLDEKFGFIDSFRVGSAYKIERGRIAEFEMDHVSLGDRLYVATRKRADFEYPHGKIAPGPTSVLQSFDFSGEFRRAVPLPGRLPVVMFEYAPSVDGGKSAATLDAYYVDAYLRVVQPRGRSELVRRDRDLQWRWHGIPKGPETRVVALETRGAETDQEIGLLAFDAQTAPFGRVETVQYRLTRWLYDPTTEIRPGTELESAGWNLVPLTPEKANPFLLRPLVAFSGSSEERSQEVAQLVSSVRGGDRSGGFPFFFEATRTLGAGGKPPFKHMTILEDVPVSTEAAMSDPFHSARFGYYLYSASPVLSESSGPRWGLATSRRVQRAEWYQSPHFRKGKPWLKVDFPKREDEPPMTAFANLDGSAFAIPGFRGLHRFPAEKGPSPVVFVLGSVTEGGKAVDYFLPLSANDGKPLLFAGESTALKGAPEALRKVGLSLYGEKIPANGVATQSAYASPFGKPWEELTVETDLDGQRLWIEGPAAGGSGKTRLIVVDVARRRFSTFENAKRWKVGTDANGLDPNVAQLLSHAVVVVEAGSGSSSGTKESKLTLILPDVTQHELKVPGTLTSLRVEPREAGFAIAGTGELPLLRDRLGVQFSWNLADPRATTIVTNLRPGDVYRDGDVAFHTSDPYLDKPPMLYVEYADNPTWELLKLEFDVGRKEANGPKGGILAFLRWLFGLPDDVESTVNPNPIEKIVRQGDLFFISTRPEHSGPPRTYVWSLQKRKLLFAVSNFVKQFEVEGLVFYVGQATRYNETVVAVFDAKDHRFITYFDLKQMDLAYDDEDFVVANAAKKTLSFKTRTGLRRVFDEKKNTFIGLVPDSIRESILDRIEGQVGNVLNQLLFMKPGDPMYGREAELAALTHAMAQRRDSSGTENVVLKAPSGAGGSHLLSEFMNRWITGALEDVGPDREVLSAPTIFFRFDPLRAAAGTMYRGQFAEKFEDLRAAAMKLREKGYQTVVVWEDAHLTDDTPHNFGEGDVFDNLTKLARDQVFTLLVTTTPEGYESLSRRHPDFVSVLGRQVRIEPMSEAATRDAIFRYLRERGLERSLTPMELDDLVSKVVRLQAGRSLPGPVFAIVKSLLGDEDVPLGERVTAIRLRRALAARSGVPAFLLDEKNLRATDARLRREMKVRLIGQDGLVDATVNAIIGFAQGLNRGAWPVWRVLLPGLTGTGKTEYAWTLADLLFESRKPVLKINGADYAGPDVTDLKKRLARHVRAYGFCIVLLDEFEKMSAEARNEVLSIGDGDFTDENGNTVSSGLTILIATSNVGEKEAKAKLEQVRRPLGFGAGTVSDARLLTEEQNVHVEQEFLAAVTRELSAPVRNRFDAVFVTKPLTLEAARRIVRPYLLPSESRLAAEPIATRFAKRGIALTFTEALIDFLANRYVDVELGARRLAIALEQNLVLAVLAPRELDGTLRAGGRYEVDVEGDRIVVRRKP